MGCDIHAFVEVRTLEGKWEANKREVFGLDEFYKKRYEKDKTAHPNFHRNYALFAFLADVRNYSACEPLLLPRGLPDEVSQEIKNEYKRCQDGYPLASYFTLQELLDFDYDQFFWDRRTKKEVSPGFFREDAFATHENEGKIVTYREHVGQQYWQRVEEMKGLGEPERVRMVFWFDCYFPNFFL